MIGAMAHRLLPRTLGGLPAMDVLLAVALCLFAVGGLVTGAVQERPLTVTLPVATLSTLLIAVRTRFPTAVAAVIVALSFAQAFLTGATPAALWSLVVMLVMAYTVGAERDEGWALIGLVIVMGGELFGEWFDQGTDYAFVVLVFGGVWLFGRGTRSWHNQAMDAEQHQRDLAQLAVATERARIARELHDVVAHSLSVIAVQADAAEAALSKAPERAAAPMRAIRDSARDALVDMRQLLRMLHDEEDPNGLSPAHGVDDLQRLVTEIRSAGLPELRADIRVHATLPASLGLAAFRIAQEGLTNVRKHAGNVPTSLVVASSDHELRIEVHNEAPASPPASDALSTGHGLVGVRERAHAAGGTVRAGTTASGGYTLTVCLPLAGEEP